MREFTGKVPGAKIGTEFVRACAVETHMDKSQKPFAARIYQKNARGQTEHPDQAPALTLTVRTPQSGHTVWGKGKLTALLHFP